jgi:hypothetical protein
MKKKGTGPVRMISARLPMLVAIVIVLQTAAPLAGAQSLDFAYYRTRVEPIFLKKRPTHARCVVCHSTAENTTVFRLQPLSPGSSAWTEDQSRLNFAIVSQLVIPGDPTSSRLLKHPLSPDAGGDPFHGGGRQFASQKDPDWQVLAAWVRQAKK